MVNSRRKGKRGELEVSKLLQTFGFSARRGQQFKGTPDSPDVVGFPGFHVEVKMVEKLNVEDALAVCERTSHPDDIPVLFHRRKRKRWRVTLSADDFLLLVSKANLDPYSDVLDTTEAASGDAET